MYMRVVERLVAISPGVHHGGTIHAARRELIKRNFVMKTVRIEHGKNLNHG